MQPLFPLAALPAMLALASCASVPPDAGDPQAAFWDALSSHCGQAYRGTLVSDDARDAEMADRAMIAHWAQCSDRRIAIAFHIFEGNASEISASGEGAGRQGHWNRSRTWIVARHSDAITLKHDHRHADGEADVVTFYGGTTATPGTPDAQDFPVDQESIALFEREGLDASLTNRWRMEVDPAGEEEARFVYQLTRGSDPSRLFRVAFDASMPVTPPPPAWGWD